MQNDYTPQINSVFTELLKEYQPYVKNESIAIRFLLIAKVFLIIFGIYYYASGKSLRDLGSLVNIGFALFLLIYGTCVFYYLKGAKHWRKIRTTLKETATKYKLDSIQLTKDFNSIAQKKYGGRGVTL